MEVLSPEYIEDLFRLSVLFAGRREAALELLAVALSEAEGRATQWRTQRQRFLWTFRFLSELASKRPAADLATAEMSDFARLLQSAIPRVRPALVLQSIGVAKSFEVAQLFGLRQGEMRLAWSRHRERSSEAGMEESAVRDMWRRVCLSPEERTYLENSVKPLHSKRRGADRLLAVGAVLLGVCVLLSFAGWEYWRKTPGFLAGLRMQEFLELQSGLGPAGIEAFEGSLGGAQDWFFLHGLDDVSVPPPFAGVVVRDARMVEWNGSRAARFSVQSPEGMLVVVEAGAIGLSGESQEGGRTRFGEWSGAWAVSGRYAVLLLVRSSEDVLESFLRP
jgi:hypothetical protein